MVSIHYATTAFLHVIEGNMHEIKVKLNFFKSNIVQYYLMGSQGIKVSVKILITKMHFIDYNFDSKNIVIRSYTMWRLVASFGQLCCVTNYYVTIYHIFHHNIF